MAAQPKGGRLLWAAQWRSRSNLSGAREYLLNENCLPVMFLSRDAARAWIKDKFGYIAMHPDLRVEPHGWKMPRAVRVRVIVSEAA